MEDIQFGALGHNAVQHATMELNSAVAHAQIPRLQTVERNAQDRIEKYGYARLLIHAQLMEDIQIGTLGHNAVQHATTELNSAVAHAQIPRLQTVERNAQDQIEKYGYARLLIHAQLMEDTQIGAHGHCAVQHATMELKIAVAHAQIPRLQTAANHVQGQVEKCGYARTLLRAHLQLMEDIQIGALGHCALQHVTMELNSVFVHAQIHRLQTVESNAQGLIKKHGYVETLIRAHFQLARTFCVTVGASGG